LLFIWIPAFAGMTSRTDQAPIAHFSFQAFRTRSG
jgi:hypothetical protein